MSSTSVNNQTESGINVDAAVVALRSVEYDPVAVAPGTDSVMGDYELTPSQMFLPTVIERTSQLDVTECHETAAAKTTVAVAPQAPLLVNLNNSGILNNTTPQDCEREPLLTTRKTKGGWRSRLPCFCRCFSGCGHGPDRRVELGDEAPPPEPRGVGSRIARAVVPPCIRLRVSKYLYFRRVRKLIRREEKRLAARGIGITTTTAPSGKLTNDPRKLKAQNVAAADSQLSRAGSIDDYSLRARNTADAARPSISSGSRVPIDDINFLAAEANIDSACRGYLRIDLPALRPVLPCLYAILFASGHLALAQSEDYTSFLRIYALAATAHVEIVDDLGFVVHFETETPPLTFIAETIEDRDKWRTSLQSVVAEMQAAEQLHEELLI